MMIDDNICNNFNNIIIIININILVRRKKQQCTITRVILHFSHLLEIINKR